METSSYFKANLILTVLFTVTCLLLVFTVDTRFLDRAGIRQELPVSLSENWQGSGILFCQNKDHDIAFLQENLTPEEDGTYRCKQVLPTGVCNAPLAPGRFQEYASLPPDTVIFKKLYREEEVNRTVTVGVVVSGRDRTSIHRPELCMPSQGNEIQLREVIQVPLEGRDPLEVMVLDLMQWTDDSPPRYTYYAYWFVGHGRETPHHLERMKWMATDKIFRNISHRWAYVQVSGMRSSDAGNKDHHDEIRDVISKLHPQLVLEQE